MNTIVTAQIEKYKSELNKELEEVRTDLKIMENEYTITFTKLHEEQAQAIKELYIKSLELNSAIFDLTQPAQGPEWSKNMELNDRVYTALRIFNTSFNLNKIYLNEKICNKIKIFIDKCYDIESKMYYAKIMEESTSVKTRLESKSIWINQYKTYNTELSEITEELINEFRNLLGVK